MYSNTEFTNFICLFFVKHSLNLSVRTKSNVKCPLAKFWLDQLMLLGPHKNFAISQVYFPSTKNITTLETFISWWLSLNLRLSLMSYTLWRILLFTFSFSMTLCSFAGDADKDIVNLSCFHWTLRVVLREEYVSLSNGLEFQSSFKYYCLKLFLATLRFLFLLLDVYSPSFIYSARILEEFHLIRLDLSPT